MRYVLVGSSLSTYTLVFKLSLCWIHKRPASSAMNFWRPARLLVLFSLVGYFITKIIQASKKLQEGELGISVDRKKEELVEGSTFCICYFTSKRARLP